VVAGFIASPITSLNPMVGAGMVVGLVEAWRRRPTVEDAENINRDVQSVRGFYKNPFTRVLLVTFASTLGSALGAWIGASWVVALLA
jgi:pheromone shutdown protein TraB